MAMFKERARNEVIMTYRSVGSGTGQKEQVYCVVQYRFKRVLAENAEVPV